MRGGKHSRCHVLCKIALCFLTVGAEVFVGAVCTVLLPVAGVRDVDAAAVVTLELVARAATCADWAERASVVADLDKKNILSLGIFSSN